MAAESLGRVDEYVESWQVFSVDDIFRRTIGVTLAAPVMRRGRQSNPCCGSSSTPSAARRSSATGCSSKPSCTRRVPAPLGGTCPTSLPPGVQGAEPPWSMFPARLAPRGRAARFTARGPAPSPARARAAACEGRTASLRRPGAVRRRVWHARGRARSGPYGRPHGRDAGAGRACASAAGREKDGGAGERDEREGGPQSRERPPRRRGTYRPGPASRSNVQ